MKLLCEFKKDSARSGKITFGYSEHDLTGVNAPYHCFESALTSHKSAIAEFSKHIETVYNVQLVRVEILRRFSGFENIGLFMLVLNKKGGAA